jgi:hypothetical protein
MKENTTTQGRRVVIVHWKTNALQPFEVYSYLKNFCLSHPLYPYNTLNNYLSKKRIPFENEILRIERKLIITKPDQPAKPNLPKRLFWEFRYDEIDWQKEYDTVIERIVERGSPSEWEEMIGFYGAKKVKHTLKKDINYLSDRAIKKVTNYFNLKPEELKCYIRKQSRPQHWI